MRKAVLLLCLVTLLSVLHAAHHPRGGRVWTYVNLTTVMSPHWAFVAMPGVRYEFARSDPISFAPANKLYFLELLAGPVYTIRVTPLFALKLPLWYYYMGYPVNATGDYYYSHNIEFLPIVELRANKLTLTSRTIFHNTVYASVYETVEERSGYGLVVREMLKLDYRFNETLSLVIAEEPFWGVVEDSHAPTHVLGYWPKGFRLNRVYTGFNIKVGPHYMLSPQYVYETSYDNGHVVAENHYLYITFTRVLKLF